MEAKSVTFDTNVFSHIVRPDGCEEPSLKGVCIKIRNLIENGSIRPHLSETIFNLEGIERKDRSSYFGTYQPCMTTEILPSRGSGTIHGRVAIGPNFAGRPTSNPILVEKLEVARSLRFRLLSAPRPGLPRNPLLTPADFGDRTSSEMEEQQSRFFDALDFITSLGAGVEVARAIGNAHRKDEAVWYGALIHASKKQATLAIGEWSDGDSVATHISYRIDYFCTRDEARDTGPQSVFASANRAKLSGRYGIVFVTPEELLHLISPA